jgi:hypothetical protein
MRNVTMETNKEADAVLHVDSNLVIRVLFHPRFVLILAQRTRIIVLLVVQAMYTTTNPSARKTANC